MGLINIVRNMYTDNTAYVDSNGHLLFLYVVLCGVLQGCPLSGFLFNIAIDPFLHNLERLLATFAGSLVRACADDIGVSTIGFGTLRYLALVFERFARISGLKLNPRKCKIILGNLNVSDENIHFLSE